MQLVHSKNVFLINKHEHSGAAVRLRTRRCLSLYVPANNPTGNVMLNASLGQFGISGLEFQRKFLEVLDDLALSIDDDIVLRVRVELFRNRSFSVLILQCAVSFLLYEEFLTCLDILMCLSDDEYVYFFMCRLSTVFFVTRFLSRKIFKNISFLMLFRTILGTLASMHVVIYDDIAVK